jgi:TctA family transporter
VADVIDVLADFGGGLATALTVQNLLYCFVGVFLGTLVGVLPGIGSMAAIAMLLPVTFHLEPTTAIVMLAGVFYGSEYGGSTTAILLNLPGSPSSAVTCLDGNQMARQGSAGVALFTTTLASFVGAIIGILALVLFAPGLADIALRLGAAEHFALMALGLVASAAISQGSPVKGLAMVMAGILFGTIGMDVQTGIPRFHLGFVELFDGLSVLAVAMGLFGVSEVIASVMLVGAQSPASRVSLRSMVPRLSDLRRSLGPILRGSTIGTAIGALPGTGQTIASFMSYAVEKRLSHEPERFGKGAIEGVASPEAANNAAVQAAFIPTLTLGIPGSATMALMLGALMIHGIRPGPMFMQDHPEIFWGLVGSFWIGNLMLVVLNIPMIGLWVRLLAVPYRHLYPIIVCLICVGVYSVNNSAFDVWIVLLFGLIGYGLRLLGFELAPMLIGFVLGPLFEDSFRRAMLLARGDILTIMQRPIAGTTLVLIALLLIYAAVASVLRGRRARRSSLAE